MPAQRAGAQLAEVGDGRDGDEVSDLARVKHPPVA
jgi:hypothetical protein